LESICECKRHITNGNCSPPCSGGSGSAKYRSGYALCGILLHHILPALVFASQSPYSGWQNVSYLERCTKCAKNINIYIDKIRNMVYIIKKVRNEYWNFMGY